MRRTTFLIVLLSLLSFQSYTQSINLKNGKVYRGKEVILNIAPIPKDAGISVLALSGNKLVDICRAYIDREDEMGYIVKFLDDNATFLLFRKTGNNLFFQNIITELITTGAITDQQINLSGKAAYLQKNGVNLQTCKSEYYINY